MRVVQWCRVSIAVAGLIVSLSAVVAAQTPATLVKDINPGLTGAALVCSPIQVGPIAFFAVREYPFSGLSLWRTNGTVEGAVALLPEISNFLTAASSNGTLLSFTYHSGQQALELWKSDGAALGTVQVKVIDDPNRQVGSLVDANGTLFFGARDAVHGYELWKSDGERCQRDRGLT